MVELNRHGSALVYSTYLGGTGDDGGGGIAVDSERHAYVASSTNSPDFPTTPGAFQTTFAGGTCGTSPNTHDCYDAVVVKLNRVGSKLIYSTYLGGSRDEFGNAIALDAAGNATSGEKPAR